jgi:hypothetical protein
MPTPRKTQKQIARRYAGNLRYFRKLHPLRRARILLGLGCLLIALDAAVIYLGGASSSRRLETIGTSGGISQAHHSFAQDCKKCHDPVEKIDPLKPAVTSASLDTKCEVCHTQHTFHVADAVVGHACIDCHHEHLGTGPMQPVKDANCQACHGDAAIMQASAQKGLSLPAGDFQTIPPDPSLVYFRPPRPPAGYTQVFQSFEGKHPDFQIQRENLTDPNTLKFNHKLHLTGDIPQVDGRKLDCAYCHQPDSRGAYMQPIRFAKNCQACHALQIDPTLPDFQIPHPTGSSQAGSVRDFLLTLPTQYASYATEKKGLTSSTEIAAFVNRHMTAIRERIRAGADLEQEVFFADASNVHLSGATPTGAQERALFPGCAYCHEVKTSPANEPVVTRPVTPDRWYVHAQFDHAAHATMQCEACHGQVFQSTLTSDINLPDKASCVTCHSAKGGVVSTCSTCHNYHNKAPDQNVAATSVLRLMMPAHP